MYPINPRLMRGQPWLIQANATEPAQEPQPPTAPHVLTAQGVSPQALAGYTMQMAGVGGLDGRNTRQNQLGHLTLGMPHIEHGFSGVPQNHYVPTPTNRPERPTTIPKQRPNAGGITAQSYGSKAPAAPEAAPPRSVSANPDYYPPAPKPDRSILNAFGRPVSDGVQRRAADLQAFQAGRALPVGAQFGNQALGEALMKRKQSGLR